jgi:hypothetical protein
MIGNIRGIYLRCRDLAIENATEVREAPIETQLTNQVAISYRQVATTPLNREYTKTMKTAAPTAYIEKRTQGMIDALHTRINPRAENVGCSSEYRSMSVIEIAREFLDMHGIDTRGKSRLEVSGMAIGQRSGSMMGTGDFSALIGNVASKRLRTAYDENPGTYLMWARRAPDAPDFRSIDVAQMSGAPQLLQTNEHGEFKYGTLSDSKESYSVITYGRLVSLSRQAMINDDLRGFDRLIQAFAVSARRLENRLVYAQLTGNKPMSDGVALFHASHANLGAGAGSALQLSSLSDGRSAMRLQKGMQDEELNLAPSFLIVPAALETTAYQLTSGQYVPATTSAINEFRAGGRTAVQPVIEPLLDSVSSTEWYLAASSGQTDTVEYCYLSGADGPVIETNPGFSTDGISMKCRLDFAAKAIDHRGLYKADGQ